MKQAQANAKNARDEAGKPSPTPGETGTTGTDLAGADGSIDAALDQIIAAYRATARMDGAGAKLRQSLHARLRAHGIDEQQLRLLEVNMLENLSAWVELVIAENLQGRNRIPDFARNLQHVFIEHCRQHRLKPEAALAMAIELATAIIDTTLTFKQLLRIEGNGHGPDQASRPQP